MNNPFAAALSATSPYHAYEFRDDSSLSTASLRTPATDADLGDSAAYFDQHALHGDSSHHLEDRECSYRVGDWIIVSTHDGSPQVGQVTHVSDHDDGSHALSIWNYALPEQTHHLPTSTFWENEVFRTTGGSIWPCSAVVTRCCVMSLEQLSLGRPCSAVWDPSTPLFVCESRYLPELGCVPFAPLRSWTPLDLSLLDFYPYPRQPPQVPSPFLRGIRGSGGLLRTDGPSYEQALPPMPCVGYLCPR